MVFRRTVATSLARRFAVAAAMLATTALLLITAFSWWLVREQQAAAVRVLNQKEAEFHASAVSRTLHGIASRMADVAGSSILATGLVDSAGREIYLTPFLNSIKQISGLPVQILFTDFEGKEISSNGYPRFSSQQLQWFKRRLDSGTRGAAIFAEENGPELVAVEPMGYDRTQTPEGAVLYKVALADVRPSAAAQLAWSGQNVELPADRDTAHVIIPVDVPEIYEPLGLRLVEQTQPASSRDLAPQYAVIFVIAVALAGGVFVLGARLALTLTQDLRRLEAFSSTVVKEGFGSQRAEVSGSTEVAGLARSINHMLDRLHDQHALLQQESEKLHQLANTIPQLAWIADPDGWVHWYNDRWYQYSGKTKSDMEGWGWQGAVHSSDLSAVTQAWQSSLAVGTPFESTFRMRSASGGFRTFFTRAAPLRDGTGKIVQWFGTNTDVTSLEEAETALRESRERLKEGMVAARMVVWDWDLASGRVELSDNAQDVLGGTWDSITSVWPCVHPDDVEALRAACNDAIAHCTALRALVRLTRPDNRDVLWVDVRGKILCTPDGRPCSVRGVSLDVTERRRAEEELREADRRKDEFLAMLAHELRNPLAPISAAAELLRHTQPDAARIRQTSDIIARQVDHMTSLVNDLLDVSRVTRGLVTLDREPLSIEQIVSDAVEQVSPLIAGRGHELQVHMRSGSALVPGDRKRLVQVLANLLNNAAKYTPEGGRITLNAQTTDHDVTLSVTDNGIGIEPRMLPHVFDLFTQAERSSDRSQGGLGLGLALVKTLVELHGGRVTAHSDGPGTGATFAVRLPRLPDRTAPPAESEPDTHARGSRKSLRLMVVDDNHDAAESLGMLLQAAGHAVAVEHDPHRALERVRLDVPDACLIDIGLPGMDGNQLARYLRYFPPTSETILIAVTGYGREHDRATSLAAGFDHYFVKPVDSARLTALLAELGARGEDNREQRRGG
jgi:PAS domain S-box-containing protein